MDLTCRQYNYALKAGGLGFLGGLAASWTGLSLLQRRYAHIRNLAWSFRAGAVFMSSMGVGVIFADKAGIKFDQMNYTDQSAVISRRAMSEAEKAWESLSTADKALTWTKDHKFSVVIGSWLASMGGSWLYIQSQPLTFAQKLVQARVWAQGLTVASLIGMAALVQIPSAGDKLISGKGTDDHSWEKRLQEAQQRQ